MFYLENNAKMSSSLTNSPVDSLQKVLYLVQETSGLTCGVTPAYDEQDAVQFVETNMFSKFGVISHRIGAAVSRLIKILENSEEFEAELEKLGKAHKQHGVDPKYFQVRCKHKFIKVAVTVKCEQDIMHMYEVPDCYCARYCSRHWFAVLKSS